jgi:hypothetical protein
MEKRSLIDGGMQMRLQSIEIDVTGICSIIHDCTGCPGESKHCCSCYEVTITSKEVQKIVACIPLAAHFCSDLKSHDGYENVFDQISPGLHFIETTEDGTCVFAYPEVDKTLCSLHTVAEKLGMPFREAKPESCLLWPLAFYEEGATRILTIQDDALEFACNVTNSKGRFSLCPSLADNIERVFGHEFRFELQNAANKGQPWARISLPKPLNRKSRC